MISTTTNSTEGTQTPKGGLSNLRPFSTVLVAAAMTLGACGSDTTPTTEAGADGSTPSSTSPVAEAVRLWIGAEQPDCEGVGPQTCLEVATSEDGPSELFYDQIAGFNPEVGTKYVIDVTAESVDDPAADQSDKMYTLLEIIE